MEKPLISSQGPLGRRLLAGPGSAQPGWAGSCCRRLRREHGGALLRERQCCMAGPSSRRSVQPSSLPALWLPLCWVVLPAGGGHGALLVSCCLLCHRCPPFCTQAGATAVPSCAVRCLSRVPRLAPGSEPWLPFPQGFGTIDGLSRMCLELLKREQPQLRRCPAPARLPEVLLLLVVFFPFWRDPVASFPEPETSEPRSKAASFHPLLCC